MINSKPLHSLGGILFGALLATGCASTETAQQQETAKTASNAENQQQEIPDATDQNFLDDEPEAMVSYRHPRVATSRQTRFFVRSFLTKKTKPALDSCQDYVAGMSTTASSRPVFLKNLRSLKDKIETEPLIYHRCFYYGLMTLDTQLARRRFGDDYQQVNTLFFARIRAAALLATGLGQHLDTKQYVDFLRSRYIEMSYSYFGRKVVPGDIRSPRQFPQSPRTKAQSKVRKAAGEWQPDE